MFVTLYNSEDLIGVEASVFGLLSLNIIYSFYDLKKRFIFLVFQITFLVFLLGHNFADALSIADDIFTVDIEEEFSYKTQLHIYLTLFISLVGVYLGYDLNEIRKESFLTINKASLNSIYVSKLREYSKKFMYFFSIFAFVTSLERAVFVQHAGYVEYYVSFTSFLPPIFYRFEMLYELSLFLFLATFPRWKECRSPLLIYFLIGCLSLGYGQRNGIMLTIAFITIYFIIRHLFKVYGNSEVWINKKRMIVACAIFPFLLIFMYAFGSTRVDVEVKEHENVVDNFLAFFAQQGNSARIIGYEKEFDERNMFPEDIASYTFGYLIDMYQQNAIFRKFGIYPTLEPLSEEMAMKGHNFSQTITYLYDPNYYFMGLGLGSCYIAEVHHDFGLWGVFIINFLYGLLFALFYKYSTRNPWILFMGFVIITSIIYAPRSGALSFINLLISPSAFAFIILIHFMTKKYKLLKLKI